MLSLQPDNHSGSMPYSDALLAVVLANVKRVSIVGLSPRFGTPGYGVAVYLERRGHTVIPVNPKHTEK
jgi:predicted CoA-binding protein